MQSITSRAALVAWRITFLSAAVWTMLGALPGLLDAAGTFERFYGVAAESERLLDIYRGAWGQSLLFAIGYLLAAIDPYRHAAILVLGVIGKAVYAFGLAQAIVAGEVTSPVATAAVVGDTIFAIAFAVFVVASGALVSLFKPEHAR